MTKPKALSPRAHLRVWIERYQSLATRFRSLLKPRQDFVEGSKLYVLTGTRSLFRKSKLEGGKNDVGQGT
jgi:hypothetical protein